MTQQHDSASVDSFHGFLETLSAQDFHDGGAFDEGAPLGDGTRGAQPLANCGGDPARPADAQCDAGLGAEHDVAVAANGSVDGGRGDGHDGSAAESAAFFKLGLARAPARLAHGGDGEDLAADGADPRYGTQRWLSHGDEFWEHARLRLPAAPTKRRISRPLYPERLAERELGIVLRAAARFVYHYGFLPNATEIATGLRAHRGAVQYYLAELRERGLIQSISYDQRKCWSLLPAGWNVVGVAPIEPWNFSPRATMSRVARAIAKEITEQERAAAQEG